MSSTLRPQERYFGILVEFLTQEETISSTHYLQTLQELSHVHVTGVQKREDILQHDNAQPRTARMCVERFRKTAGHFYIHPTFRT